MSRAENSWNDGVLREAPAPDDTGTVRVPDGIIRIGFPAFRGKEGVRRVILPYSVMEIGRNAFEDCRELEEINIPAHLQDLEFGTFRGCCSLVRIRFGDMEVSDGEVVFPEGLQEIHTRAFQGCAGIRRVRLNDAMQLVESYAFADCVNLEEISGSKATKLESNVLRGCPSTVRVLLPREAPKGKRGHLGLPDADGFVIDSRQLKDYVGSASVVRIPDGVRRIREDALSRLASDGAGEKRQVIFPPTLQHIGANRVLLQSHIESKPPAGFFAQDGNRSDFLLELVRGPWRPLLRTADMAALYLYQKEKVSNWAAETVEVSPAAFAAAMISPLRQTKTEEAVRRAAAYFTRHAAGIPKRTKDEMQKVAAETDDAGQTARHPYREALLDVILRGYGVDPADDAFSAVALRGGQNAAPLTVKSAIVPYILQGADMTEGFRRDRRKMQDAAAYIPEADAQAARLDPNALSAALQQLIQYRMEQPELVYAAARFSTDNDLNEIIRRAGAETWGGHPRNNSWEMAPLVRAACLLNDCARAVRLVVESPGWVSLRENHRRLHPGGPAFILPADPPGLLNGSASLKSGKTTMEVRVGDGLTVEIREAGSGKVWKQMPRKLSLPAADKEKLTAMVEAAGSMMQILRRQIDEKLFQAYVSGEEIDPEWLASVHTHPVFRKGLSQILFERNGTVFVFRDGEAETLDGQPFALPPDLTGLRVAHTVETEETEMDGWRRKFGDEGWKSWQQQLEEPRYALAEVPTDRFDGREVTLGAISDESSRVFMLACMDKLHYSTLDGAKMRSYRSQYPTQYELGEITLEKITRRVNRVLYHLDQLTALERLRENDPSVLKFYTLANNARLNNALRETIKNKQNDLTGELLAIQNGRKKQTSTRTAADLSL